MTRALIVTPAGQGGNATTAARWREILTALGLTTDVATAESLPIRDYHALVVLHARKSAAAIRRFSAQCPGAPIVLALTGTDLYPDLATAGVDPDVLDRVDHIVVLQNLALRQLQPSWRVKTTVIEQSVPAVPRRTADPDRFEIAYVAHLRPVKDPLTVGQAVAALSRDSKVLITHAGTVLDPRCGQDLRAITSTSRQFRSLGTLSRPEVLALIGRSRALLVASRHEGGANVVSEALAAGTPVISSDIPGSTGLLGTDYAGLFPVGDAPALTRLLVELENDRSGLLRHLEQACAALRYLVDPQREEQRWKQLLTSLAVL